MKTSHRFAAVTTFLLLATTTQAQGVGSDLTNCRGVNYVVSGKHNSIDQWLNYDESVVEDNLDTLENFGINAVRVFSSFRVWKDPSLHNQYMLDLGHLAEQVFDHDMLLMLVLFDSFGADPDDSEMYPGWTLAQFAESGWFQSPGSSYLPVANDPNIADFVSETISAVNAANAVVPGQWIYDIWNEPPSVVMDDVAEIVDLVENEDQTARKTVGFADANGHGLLSNLSALDVLCFHPYGIYQEVIEDQAEVAANYALGRPICASEAVNHGAGQDYAHILRWLEDEQVGFFAWEAFASVTQFAMLDGLFYKEPIANGVVEVRDLEGVHTLLRMAIDDGFQPTSILAKLRVPGSGYIQYYPTQYDFSVKKAQDLVANWVDLYEDETYSSTPLHGYQQGLGTRPVDFYRKIQDWAALSGLRLSPPNTEETNQWKALTSDLQEAIDDTEDYILGGGQNGEVLQLLFSAIDDAFLARNVFLEDEWILPFADPLINTSPEIVYVKGWWKLTGTPPLAQFTLRAKMLVNDADRLSDVDVNSVDISYSSNGGQTYTSMPLNMTDFLLKGYVTGQVNLSPTPGKVYCVRGFVSDGVDSVQSMWIEVPAP